jgi:hypothetical protein
VARKKSFLRGIYNPVKKCGRIVRFVSPEKYLHKFFT